jgi:hypothetical protein
MANTDKASHDQAGLERHREITNTGGQLDDDRGERQNAPGVGDEVGLSTNKVGDDAWHHRANRRSEKGDDSVPMQGGNTAR